MDALGNIDFECWSPQLMVARFSGVPSDVRIEQYLDWMTDNLRASHGIALILDATHSSLSHPAFIRRQATWLKNHRLMIKDRCYGTALVLNGAVLRFTLSSILLVAPSPGPIAVHATFAESLAWADALLTKHGHHFPRAPFGSQSRSA